VSDTAPDLPPLLSSIAEIAGEAAALAVARAHGGTRVTVPVRAEGTNWLTAIVGPAAAVVLIDRLGGGTRIDIPLGPEGRVFGSRRQLEQQFDALVAEGKSGTAIARILGVTDRTVRNKKRARRSRDEADRATGQRDLFR
jgi:hypothetical protein